MTIPLHTFIYDRGSTLPFMIERIELLPPIAQAAYPNRHTFYEVFWIVDGAGNHMIDFQAYPINPPCLYWVAPGQIHFWDVASKLSGFAVLFPVEFFELSAHTSVFKLLSLWQSYTTTRVVYPSQLLVTQFQRWFEMVYVEYQSEQLCQLIMLQSLMSMILITIERLLTEQTTESRSPRPKQITESFLRLIDQAYAQQNRLIWYAEHLSVTPGHLSDMVKEITGLSASSHIRQRIILEAKRLLAHSDQSIADIAWGLGFQDAAYFTRFFKREVVLTPYQFRQQFREKYNLLHE